MADLINLDSFSTLSTNPKPEVAPADAPADDTEDYTSWDNAQVLKHLESIGMSAAIIAKFKEFEVTGEDLEAMTANELKADMGLTTLQAKRIKRSLDPDAAGEEAADAKDREDAVALSKRGTLAPPADLSAAEEPMTAMALRDQGSITRKRSPAVGVAMGTPVLATPAAAAAAHQHVTPTHQYVTPAQLLVDPNLVAQWASKTALIAKLQAEQVAEKLPAASQRLVFLKQAFADETTKFKELQKVNEKLEVKALESSRKLEAAGKVVEDLAGNVEVQEQLVAQLNSQVHALVEAKKWEANALQTAFGGAAGDARENHLEAELAGIVPQLEQTRRYKISYNQAYELILGARKMLDKAAQLFRSAHGLATIDVVSSVVRNPRPLRGGRNGPAGMMVDVAKRAQSRQGVALCEQAAGAIQRAAQIIPDMPRVDLKKVQGLRGLGVFDIMFNNMIIDVMQKRKIREAMNLVESQLNDTKYAERWLEGWINGRIDQDLRALEANYALKKAELDECRRALLQYLASQVR